MQVLEEVGGWNEVLNRFAVDHVRGMDQNVNRMMILLLDLDDHIERLADAIARIPLNLRDRVFILGVLTTPEALRAAGLGSFEEIGSSLAEDCRRGTNTFWAHELLQHN